MSEHRASVRWQHAAHEQEPTTYSRAHTWAFAGLDGEVPASSAPEFRGTEDRADPEQALVAALSSCHMLTFLAVAERKGLAVTAYEDDAVGYLGKDERGRMAVVRVELRPRISFAEEAPDEAAMASLHKRAHRGCFLANSVRTEVVVLPQQAS